MTTPQIIVCVGFVLLLFILCLIWPISNWFRAFIKVDQTRIPYFASFFALLLIAVVVLEGYLSEASPLILAFLGAIIGHIAASVSIPIASFFDPNGFEGVIRAMQNFGVMKVVFVYLSVSLVLGGWLFGAISFIALKFLMRSFRIQEKG